MPSLPHLSGTRQLLPPCNLSCDCSADLISSRHFEDGSYVRLQDLTLSYRLPPQWASALRMAESRLYVSGRNLHTWTKYSGYSPDVNSNGSNSNTALSTEFYAYPLARTIMVGITGAF